MRRTIPFAGLRKRIALACLLFESVVGLAQPAEQRVRPQIRALVDSIDAHGPLEYQVIGNHGGLSQQYQRFEKLYQQGEPAELIALTDHKNPVIRCYAFWGLAKQHSDSLETILQRHMDDQEAFAYRSGCIIDATQVNAFILNIVTPRRVDRNCQKLSARKRRRLRKQLVP